MIITERLKAARKECRLTQQQVADLLGVDRSTYAYYELGVSKPSLENVVLLSGIFKVDIEWMLGTDRDRNSWNSSENQFSVMRAVKEKEIGVLSKDERQLVALYRIAGIYGKQHEVFSLLKSITETTEDEE